MAKEKPVHLFTMSPSQNFMMALVSGLWDRCGQTPENLARYTILLPTRRACRSLSQTFLNFFEGKPTLLPRIIALGDLDHEEMCFLSHGLEWAETLSSMPPSVSSIERQFVLAQMILSSKQYDLSDDDAFSLAGELGLFIDEFITEGVDYDDLKNIVPDYLSDHWQVTLDFLQVILHHWPDYLASEGKIDAADRRNRLLRTQAKIWNQSSPDDRIIIAGVTGTIPAAAELLSCVARLPKGLVVLPGLDLMMNNESWDAIDETHPQHGLKKLLDSMKAQRSDVVLWQETESQDKAKEKILSEIMTPASMTDQWSSLVKNDYPEDVFSSLHLIECEHEQEEAESAALVLRQALEKEGQTVCLVTPDRSLARRVASIMKRWNIDVDDSAGTPLPYTKSGSWLLVTAQFLSTQNSPLCLLSLLKHPLFKQRMGVRNWTDHINFFEKTFLRGVRSYQSIHDLRQKFESQSHKMKEIDFSFFWDAIEEAIEVFNNNSNFTDRLSSHLHLAEALLQRDSEKDHSLLWQGDDGESLARLTNDILSMSETIKKFGNRDLSYQSIVRMLMQPVSVRPKYGLHPRVSILGLMEARLIQSDVTIMAGLNEGMWPPEAKADPFLSRRMREECGLPTADKWVGMAAHDFVEKCCSPCVYLLRAKRQQGSPTVVARWLLRMETVLGKLDQEISRENNIIFWTRELDGGEQAININEIMPQPIPDLDRRPQRFSVSSIETLRRDPYSFYARKILGLLKLDMIDRKPNYLDWGNFIHKVMEVFAKQSLKDFPENPEQILMTIGKEYLPVFCPTQTQQIFWWQRFLKVLGSIVAIESESRQESKPILLEQKGEMSFSLSDNEQAFIHAKADRINKSYSGDNVVVIDYKTGTPPSKKDVVLGFSPQLTLEALIVEAGGFDGLSSGQSVTDVQYWVLKGTKDDKVVSCFQESLLDETKEGVQSLLQFYHQSNSVYWVTPFPDKASCYNDYEHLARTKEWIGSL